MTLVNLSNNLREKLRLAALNLFNIELEQIATEIPPKVELGDLAFPIAFDLAKRIKQATGEKQNPRAIAESLKSALESNAAIKKIEIAGAGYLNIFFERGRFIREFWAAPAFSSNLFAVDESRPKRMIEHTSVNPNKAAHIGHVRNAVLGDTFARILRANNELTEVQNYIDNTGVQVADVVVGFAHLEKMSLADVQKLDSALSANQRFDYFCWDLYARVNEFYKESEENLKLRSAVLHELEKGSGEIYELADYVATRNVQCILATMERLSIRYDVLPRESEILHLNFWQTAFERMQQLGVIRKETAGKNAGCWVMPFGEFSGTDEHDADKILVRSNNTVTYTGKDIAYQMWKLGLLGLDFYYKLFHTYPDGHQVWITTSDAQIGGSESQAAPNFGNGAIAYNVIDSRQSYPQEIVKRGVAAIAPDKGAEASVHLAYEMVALSPAAAAELGFQLSEEDKTRIFIEMSGRRGLGVKVDDLIDRLEENALGEVAARHPDLPADEKQKIAHQLAVGALRYFLLKFTKNTVIVFDFKEALAFEGETGIYCQNAALRLNSIFRKLGLERQAEAAEMLQNSNLQTQFANFFDAEENNEIWSLIILAARLEETISQAALQTEPAILAKYTFMLAKTSNLFYQRFRIVSEENALKRAALVTVAEITRRQLTAALEILGIEVPDKM